MTPADELLSYIQEVQDFHPDNGQDAQALTGYLIRLTNIMARANGMMAEYQKQFRKEKKRAYERMAASSMANNKYFTPSLAKDYIDSQCHESGYLFDLSERCSRLCSHTIDAIRTVTSSLKSERQFAGYQ